MIFLLLIGFALRCALAFLVFIFTILSMWIVAWHLLLRRIAFFQEIFGTPFNEPLSIKKEKNKVDLRP